MHLLSDLMKGKYMALENSRRQGGVAEIEKSWKSYTCFSGDYLKKNKKKLFEAWSCCSLKSVMEAVYFNRMAADDEVEALVLLNVIIVHRSFSY